MDTENNIKECTMSSSSSSVKSSTSSSDISEPSKSGPAFLFFSIWHWIAGVFTDIKNGQILHRFTLLDAIIQFVIAVATSCHPQGNLMQEESYDDHDHKSKDSPSKKDIKVFGGTGRTLRSRTVDASS